MDLPNEILHEVIKYSKIGAGFKLRLNRELEQRIHSFIETITVKVCRGKPEKCGDANKKNSC